MQGGTVEGTRFKFTQIGGRLEMHQTTVNNWVKRFEEEGIKGLGTRPGRGRKPIIGAQAEEIIRYA